MGTIPARAGEPRISNTPAVTMEMQWSMDRAELRQRNIVFQQDASSYINEILRAATTA